MYYQLQEELPVTGRPERLKKQPVTELFTTSITEAEIFYGIQLLTKGKRREGLLAAEAMFAEDLAGHIFGFESGRTHCSKMGTTWESLRQTCNPREHIEA